MTGTVTQQKSPLVTVTRVDGTLTLPGTRPANKSGRVEDYKTKWIESNDLKGGNVSNSTRPLHAAAALFNSMVDELERAIEADPDEAGRSTTIENLTTFLYGDDTKGTVDS